MVEEEIARSCASCVGLVSSVSSYIAGGGGKRLRPSVLLLSSGLCGLEEGDGRIACAAAVELTHIASLLHDDVVDNASMRRGRRSSNAVWGNKSPVLTGDMLLIKALNLILSCDDMELARVYCAAAGRMIEGEAFEVMRRKEMLEMDESSCMRIVTEKTASLMECCAVMGAMLAGQRNGHNGGNGQAEALAGYGLNLGIAFQLADDALDYCSTAEELGKDAGLDIENAGMTLPLLKAISNAPSRVRADFEKELRRATAADFAMPEFVAPIKRFVADYGGVESTFERAKSHTEKAKEAISKFPSGGYKDSLITLADFAAERSH